METKQLWVLENDLGPGDKRVIANKTCLHPYFNIAVFLKKIYFKRVQTKQRNLRLSSPKRLRSLSSLVMSFIHEAS